MIEVQLPFVKITRFANSIQGELSALGGADGRPRLEELRLLQPRYQMRNRILSNAKILLDRGVPVDSVRFESVCYSGDSELIQLFLDRGSDNIALFLQCRVVNDFSSRADYHNGLRNGYIGGWIRIADSDCYSLI